jgi:hypothetical protein
MAPSWRAVSSTLACVFKHDTFLNKHERPEEPCVIALLEFLEQAQAVAPVEAAAPQTSAGAPTGANDYASNCSG